MSKHSPPSRAARLTLAAGLAWTAAACATAPRPAPPGAAPPIAASIRVRHDGRISTVPIDRYAAIVALTELAPGAEPPATAAALYEAQIIVARTYAASRRRRHAAEGFDLCDTTHCQRYEAARTRTGRWAALARDIATRTSGRVLVYGTSLVEAVFHADCGGHTAAAEDVWRTARPYLTARRDDAGPHRQWQSALARDAVARALNADQRTRLAGPLRDIAVAARDRSGRARRVRITAGPRGAAPVELDRDALERRGNSPRLSSASRELEREVDGDVFRAALAATLGVRALPSTRFDLARAGSGWRATGTGFGHGVGLCQAGALARARKGSSAAEILSFYYPGAIIGRAAAR